MSRPRVYPEGLSARSRRLWREQAHWRKHTSPLRVALLESALRLLDLADRCNAESAGAEEIWTARRVEVQARRAFLSAMKALHL